MEVGMTNCLADSLYRLGDIAPEPGLDVLSGHCWWDNDTLQDLPTQPGSEGQIVSLEIPYLHHSF